MSQTKAQLLEGKAANIEFSTGTAALPAITFTGDVNTGIYSPAADTIAFAEGGAEAMRIDSSGRVGIGTTAPASLFHIDGDATAIRVSRGSALGFVYNTGTSATSAFRVQSNDGSLDLYTRVAQPITFTANDAERARIDSSGRLLVGTSTATANGGVLELSGGITFPATAVAATNPNTLDDYEEGTFTPTIVYSGTNTPSYANQEGRYTKIGRIVHAIIRLSWNENGSTGFVSTGGLPFACNASGSNRAVASILSFGMPNLTIGVSVQGLGDASSTGISLFLNDNAGSNLSATTTDDSQSIYMSFTYDI